MRSDGVVLDAIEFDALRYNPFVVPRDELFVEYYQDLKRHRMLYSTPVVLPDQRDMHTRTYDDWTMRDADQLVRVVVAAFDEQSPVAGSSDISYRINSVVKSLGIETPVVLAELQRKDLFFRQTVYQYFRLSRSYDMEEWWSAKTLYHLFAHRTQSPSGDLTKDNISALMNMLDELPKLKSRIASLEVSLFDSDEAQRIITLERALDPYAGEPEKRATYGDPDMSVDDFYDE